MRGDGFYFEVFLGNTRRLTFVLRRYQQKTPWDISGAGQVALELSNPSGVAVAPVIADIAEPGANWTKGIVVVEVGPGDACGTIGTWTAGVTVTIGGETVTVDGGTIECRTRPGYPAP